MDDPFLEMGYFSFVCYKPTEHFNFGRNRLSLLQTQLKTVSNMPTECAVSGIRVHHRGIQFEQQACSTTEAFLIYM